MSILAAADVPVSVLALLLAVFAAVTSVAVAWLFGILRNDKLDPTRRVPPDRPMAPLVGALFAGLVVWLVLGPSLLGSRGELGPGQPLPASAPSPLFTSDRQLVIVNAVVPTAAFIVLLVGDAVVRPRVRQRLWFDAVRFPVGFALGVAGMAIAMPLVYGSIVMAEWLYRQVGYQHPPAHDLLKTMGETPEAFVRNLAIVVAVVIAPLWEELLFRGHIQTMLREGIIRLRESATRIEPLAPAARPGDTLEYFAAAPPVVDRLVDRPRPLDAWLAIVLTSLLFAGIHHPWTFPPIFVLSVCLGFAYERSRNLWVPIVMHGTFNATMTVYFLWAG
jgi:membrane protease YdiL (CAAX protease family)